MSDTTREVFAVLFTIVIVRWLLLYLLSERRYYSRRKDR